MKRRHSLIDHPFTVHFVSTTVVNWLPVFAVQHVARQTLTTFERYRAVAGLPCLAFVLMPGHFHGLLLRAERASTVSDLMMNFKKATSVQIRREIERLGHREWLATFREQGARIHPTRPRAQVWMDRYDDVAITTLAAVRTKVEYIHGNPVKGGLCDSERAYEFSSARDYFGDPNPWVKVDTQLIDYRASA
jgi:putative transposase